MSHAAVLLSLLAAATAAAGAPATAPQRQDFLLAVGRDHGHEAEAAFGGIEDRQQGLSLVGLCGGSGQQERQAVREGRGGDGLVSRREAGRDG